MSTALADPDVHRDDWYPCALTTRILAQTKICGSLASTAAERAPTGSLLAQAYLRNGQFQDAVMNAEAALSKGDMKAIGT